MNPYDDLGAVAGDDAGALLARLDEALGRCADGERWAIRAARAALEADPEVRLVWLLRSRSLGERHPIDAALARLQGVESWVSLEVDAEAVVGDLRESLLAPAQREAALKALVELPEVEPGPIYEAGLFNLKGK